MPRTTPQSCLRDTIPTTPTAIRMRRVVQHAALILAWYTPLAGTAVFAIAAETSPPPVPVSQVWLINTRCTSGCGDLEAELSKITYWRLDESFGCGQWQASDAAGFRASAGTGDADDRSHPRQRHRRGLGRAAWQRVLWFNEAAGMRPPFPPGYLVLARGPCRAAASARRADQGLSQRRGGLLSGPRAVTLPKRHAAESGRL